MDPIRDLAVTPAVRAVYGPQDLSSAPAFAGGFINFGHWDGIPLDRPLTAEDRVRSQRNLYRHVLGTLDGADARAVEVGCGLGIGAALALEEFGFAAVTGLDIHPEQLERARRANAGLLARAPERLGFAHGAAERMPFEDGRFDLLYSVEAAQHFRDLPAFVHEAARVLRPGGRLAVTSFFLPAGAENAGGELAARLESFASGLDVAHPLVSLLDALGTAGLTDVRAESIGAHVWPGLDRFLAGVDMPVQWPRNFLPAYRDGLLDYYVVTADRPPADV
ncbi:class I SAM-dependent methyltransferase [Streptomyces sp. GbtcB6]|uniref:class I SAM-dependent methyltransferase n=1 Tax=Streptomyces sp. GbtcB6 TaxID=2824751 RepID=UPI001C30049D|nr:class I SAM-dependent methyltransferase [Streptomyces sp. GbtcB6]